MRLLMSRNFKYVSKRKSVQNASYKFILNQITSLFLFTKLLTLYEQIKQSMNAGIVENK